MSVSLVVTEAISLETNVPGSDHPSSTEELAPAIESKTSKPEDSSSNKLFEELCEVKRSIYDIKGELEADLHGHLKIQSAEEIDSWKERFLASISEANEEYRSSTLEQLHFLAQRARVCGAPRELFGAVRRIVQYNGDIQTEVEKLITFYDKVAPGLSDVQRTFVGSEIQWMRSGFVMLQEVQEIVHNELQRSTFPLQVLACPHDELVEILSPLTRPPPGIESGLDTLCTQLHGLYAERLEAIQEVHEAVVTAFITWFDSDSSLDDQHATVEQMKAMRDRLSAQVARQKEVLISISLYQERTQHAPSSLNTSVGKRVDVSDLLKAMHDYDEAMKEISHVFDLELVLLQKARTSVQGTAALLSVFGISVPAELLVRSA